MTQLLRANGRHNLVVDAPSLMLPGAPPHGCALRLGSTFSSASSSTIAVLRSQESRAAQQGHVAT